MNTRYRPRYSGTEKLWLREDNKRRSADEVDAATGTNIYLGFCRECDRPTRKETNVNGRQFERIACIECGMRIQAERLFVVVKELQCDAKCHHAIGVACTCGCGGVNHGRSWAFKISESKETQSALETYRKAREKKKIAARKRRDQKNAERIEKYARYQAQRKEAQVMRQQRQAEEWETWSVSHAAIIQGIQFYASRNTFLGDLNRWLSDKRPLTENQLRFAQKQVMAFADDDEEDGPENEVVEADGTNAPKGTAVSVCGQILKTFERESPEWGTSQKMVVWDEKGYKVESTIPAVILRTVKEPTDLVGRRISFVAGRMWPSRQDNSMGIVSRPSQAKLLPNV